MQTSHLQWNILAKIAAITGARLQAVTDDHFLTARTALTAAHAHRGRPSAARTIAAALPPAAADAVPRRADHHADRARPTANRYR